MRESLSDRCQSHEKTPYAESDSPASWSRSSALTPPADLLQSSCNPSTTKLRSSCASCCAAPEKTPWKAAACTSILRGS